MAIKKSARRVMIGGAKEPRANPAPAASRWAGVHPLDRPTRRFDVGAAFVAALGLDVPSIEHSLGELIDEVCDLSGRGNALGYPAAYLRRLEALRHAYFVLTQVIRDARDVYDEDADAGAAAQRLKRMYAALPKDRKHEQPNSELRQSRFVGLVAGAMNYVRANPNDESPSQLAETCRSGFGSLDPRFLSLGQEDITRALSERSRLRAAAILIIKAKVFSAAKLKGNVDKANVEKIIDALKKAEKRAAQQIEKRKAMIRDDLERIGGL